MTREEFDPFKTGQVDLQYNQARDSLEKGLEELLDHGSRLLKEKKFTELKSFIREKTRSLNRDKDLRELRPYSLVDLEEEIANHSEGLKTGWPAVDKLISLPQEALTIIAGQPSHGKTTVLLNLFINSIKNYPKKQFLFYSYEENSKHLALKTLINLSGYCHDEVNNFSFFEKTMKEKKKSQPEINAAIEELKAMTSSRRLWLFDHGPDLDDLYDELNFLTQNGDVGGIYIDYIQKMKLKSTKLDRQRELQVISNELLRMAKAFKVPIIMGAQLKKSTKGEAVRLEQLREAGDIEQDANLILGVYNKSMIKAQQGIKVTEPTVDLTLSILKNRNGAVNQDIILRFNRPVLQIKDFSDKKIINPLYQKVQRL
jgi:replicative DNA helicase